MSMVFEALDVVDEVAGHRAAQRAVGHCDAPAAELVVGHLVDLHRPSGVGPGLVPDHDAEDHLVVREPGPLGVAGGRDDRIVERRDPVAAGHRPS